MQQKELVTHHQCNLLLKYNGKYLDYFSTHQQTISKKVLRIIHENFTLI